MRKALHIVGSTGLGSCARQPATTEWIHSNHCTDHIAIDIGIASNGVAKDLLCKGLNTAVNAESETKAGIVDLFNHLPELI